MKRFMFDTNIFNAILNDNVIFDSNLFFEFFITHVQEDELKACRSEQRRADLLKIFNEISPNEIPTESAIWGVSSWDSSKWRKEDGVYERILSELENRKPNDRGNIKDALIGETAFKTRITLVSNDKALRETIKQLGGTTMCLSDFLNISEILGHFLARTNGKSK